MKPLVRFGVRRPASTHQRAERQPTGAPLAVLGLAAQGFVVADIAKILNMNAVAVGAMLRPRAPRAKR
jgi:hypothetical protein